jgi:hypothetical protein
MLVERALLSVSQYGPSWCMLSNIFTFPSVTTSWWEECCPFYTVNRSIASSVEDIKRNRTTFKSREIVARLKKTLQLENWNQGSCTIEGNSSCCKEGSCEEGISSKTHSTRFLPYFAWKETESGSSSKTQSTQSLRNFEWKETERTSFMASVKRKWRYPMYIQT